MMVAQGVNALTGNVQASTYIGYAATAVAVYSFVSGIGGGSVEYMEGGPATLHDGPGAPLREWQGPVPDNLQLENPTGGGIRGLDGYGQGHYWAPRARNGLRYGHEGTDFLGSAGQEVSPPVVGNSIERFGGRGFSRNVYLDSGLRVTDPSGQFRVTFFHVDPKTAAILDPTRFGFLGAIWYVASRSLTTRTEHWRGIPSG